MHGGVGDSVGGAHKHVKIPSEDWQDRQEFPQAQGERGEGTSASLPAYAGRPALVTGPRVFLSCAPTDRDVGHEVARWLAERGFGVLLNGSAVPADRVVPEVSANIDHRSTQEALDAAEAYVVLLSPAFLASRDCLILLDLADRRQQLIYPASFIHVLQVADTADLDTARFQRYQPIDLTRASRSRRRAALSALGARIITGGSSADARVSLASSRYLWQAFIDRHDELDRVIKGLTSQTGPHFWLITGPPGLGKSALLRQLAAMVGAQERRNWACTMVDVRIDAVDRDSDPMALVGRLFDRERPEESSDDMVAVARGIIRAGRSYLCLLDGADFLPFATIATLRRHLSQVYRLIQDAGEPDVRLALVVGSRRDDGWRGVTPSPRFSQLPLAGFDASIVQEALGGLAARMNRQKSPAELRSGAALVHSAAEGVPPLVVRGLQWIQAQEWLEITRLQRRDVFDGIVRAYIRNQLLSQESLLPGDGSEPQTSEERMRAIELAIKWLVRYRFFTASHLRSHRSSDQAFADALERASWSIDDLWRAISSCALLTRPLDEPWHEIYPAIRRLLFRHFYTEAERADAHRAACEFTDTWSASQDGREQVIGLVDCLWHEAASLRLTDVTKMPDALTKSARERAHAIRPSDAYTEIELRTYAAERMEGDEELRGELADVEGLFESLVVVFESTAAGEARHD